MRVRIYIDGRFVGEATVEECLRDRAITEAEAEQLLRGETILTFPPHTADCVVPQVKP